MASSPKEIVEGVMTFLKRDKRPVKIVLLEFLKYRCPKSNCLNCRIMFQAGSGFQNPNAHLRA